MPNTNRRSSLPWWVSRSPDASRRARAWIAVGANVGDPVRGVQDAARAVSTLARTTVEATSRVRLTRPEGGPPQPPFANAALRVRTGLSPRALLGALAGLERQAGRAPASARAHAVNHPRPLDLDLLFFEGVVLSTAALTLPHPRLHLRRFVLDPLCDLDPQLVHPTLRRTVSELRAALSSRAARAGLGTVP